MRPRTLAYSLALAVPLWAVIAAAVWAVITIPGAAAAALVLSVYAATVIRSRAAQSGEEKPWRC